MKYKLEPADYDILTVTPLPSNSEVAAFYSQKYYQEDCGPYSKKYTDDEISYFNTFDILFHAELQKQQKKYKTFLDIGCGEGFCVSYFEKNDFQCSAVDFSSQGISHHNPDTLNKINFLQCDIVNDTFFEGQTFDCITINNVAEHVVDIQSFINNIKRLCHKDTLLSVQVPRDMSNTLLNHYLAKKELSFAQTPLFVPPEHLRYFSPQTLKNLFESNNFETITLMGDYPIQQFLLVDETDYFSNDFGKTAHKLRVQFIKALMSQGTDAARRYFESLSHASMGRVIAAFFKYSPD